MGSPSSSLATLRPDLGGSFEEFDLAMDRQGFIGQQLLPVFDVAQQAGPFGKIPIEELLQNREVERAPGGGYNRAKWTFTTDSYATQERGAEEPVDDREAKMYRNYFDAELVSAGRARDAVLRAQEKRIAALLHNTATWTGSPLTTTITNEWDDFTNATPITDVFAARQKVWDGCGLWPNVLQINRKQFHNLQQCAQIIDRIASAGAGAATKAKDITAAQIAACFDLERLVIAGAAKNTANAGQAAVLAQIWSDEYAFLARVCSTNDIREPGLGRCFHWSEDGSEVGAAMESYRDETIRGDVIRARHDVQEKVLYVQCGHLLSNVTTI